MHLKVVAQCMAHQYLVQKQVANLLLTLLKTNRVCHVLRQDATYRRTIICTK